MSNIAFVFPGQGAQYVGMGKEFYENVEVSRKVFDLASSVVGLDLKEICFQENDKINITEYTQIAMLATEIAILRAVEEKGLKAQVNAGLSLGEYAAVVASGVMSEEDAFQIIRKRGILMQEAVPTGGAMSAILGLDSDKIKEICDGIDGIVSVANYNCPGQVVITGEVAAVEAANEQLKEAGAKRTIMLNVSGPFHSAMLKEAGEKLSVELNAVELNNPVVPYVTNVTAEYVTSSTEVKELLEKQIVSSVMWQQSVEKMISEGIDTFIEIGPGKTLTGFLKKIDKSVKGFNIENLADLDKVLAELQ